MNSVLFAKMDQVFSKENKTLQKYWKFGKKYWKSQGILSVRKSGNPEWVNAPGGWYPPLGNPESATVNELRTNLALILERVMR